MEGNTNIDTSNEYPGPPDTKAHEMRRNLLFKLRCKARHTLLTPCSHLHPEPTLTMSFLISLKLSSIRRMSTEIRHLPRLRACTEHRISAALRQREAHRAFMSCRKEWESATQSSVGNNERPLWTPRHEPDGGPENKAQYAALWSSGAHVSPLSFLDQLNEPSPSPHASTFTP